jgi:CheY-like chemotaxis protein
MASCADTILVVEDDSDIREALCEWLKRRGHSVTCAANGLSALDEFERYATRPR